MLVNWSRPRDLRAFDWIGFLLYVAATISFVAIALPLLFELQTPGLFPESFGLTPTLYDEENSIAHRVIISAFALFVSFVYLRNYVVMSAIDSRKSNGYLLFYFVDYNRGFLNWLERFFRALIVIIVLITPIHFYPTVTDFIWRTIIGSIYSATAGFSSFELLTPAQSFSIYYGSVIVFLFLSFIAWDVINLISISKQIRKGAFQGHPSVGPDNDFMSVAGAMDSKFSMPVEMEKIVPVYSIVTYVRPRKKVIGDLEVETKRDQYEQKMKSFVHQGRLLCLYIRGKKSTERGLGLLIGVAMLAMPFIPAHSTYPVSILSLSSYVFVSLVIWYFATMWSSIIETITSSVRYLFEYLL